MSRIKSIIGQGSTALGLVIVVGATFGPSTVVRRAEEVAFVSWRALGDQLANHELSAISRQLDLERLDAEMIRALRDDLWARLQSLETHRERVVVNLRDRGPRLECDGDDELASLDAAIALVKSATARADRALDAARKEVRNREVEFITLQANADLARANLVLARRTGDRAHWSARIARARDLFGTALDDRDAHQSSSSETRREPAEMDSFGESTVSALGVASRDH